MKIPPKFKIIEKRADGFLCVGIIFNKSYSVISSISKEQDGKEWHHVSVSSRLRMPNYEVMKFIKATFMDQDKDAIEVHAKKSNHVNINSNCRHLWMCLDNNLLPDFTNGTGSI